MTCIIGALCAEGAVIVADTRISRGNETLNESKFRFLWGDHVVVAGSGTTKLLDDLKDEIGDKEKALPSPTRRVVGRAIEDSLADLKSRYLPRMGSPPHGDYALDVIVAGLAEFGKGDPYLLVADQRGVAENVQEYRIAGAGEPYATTLFKLLYQPMLTLKETAVLGYWVILTLISLELDQSVGVAELGPEVVLIKPDEKPRHISPFDDSDFDLARETATSLAFRENLVGSIWNSTPQAYESGEAV